jgi:uncharacterized membrane protein
MFSKFDYSLLIISILISLFILSVGWLGYVIGHTSGYEKGVSDTILYHETTGGYPTADWIECNENNTFDYPQQILDTLGIYHKGE